MNDVRRGIEIAGLALAVALCAAGEPSRLPGASTKPMGPGLAPVTNSPVTMRGIYGSRGPGARARAMADYGSSGTTEGAVLRALRWLKSVQNGDGSWGGDADAFGAGTALALMTFIAHGETTSSHEFGGTVTRGLEFLVDDMRKPGRLERRGRLQLWGESPEQDGLDSVTLGCGRKSQQDRRTI